MEKVNYMNLKVSKITDKRAYCYCPYHKDNNPSFEITLSGEHVGEYYCHGCGKAGTLTKLVLDQLLSHKGKMKKDVVNAVDWEELNKLYGNEWFWMKEPKPRPFDVGLTTLIFVDMGWDGEAYTFPMRNEKNEIIGIQRRFPDGFKCMVDGSRLGLFIPQISFDPGQAILITEGVSDLCTVLELGGQGIGRPNNDTCLEMVLPCLLGKDLDEETVKSRLFIISDNDAPGIKGSIQLAELLGLKGTRILLPETKDVRGMKEEKGFEYTQQWLEASINANY